jgi:excisionase family DNA binding protein
MTLVAELVNDNMDYIKRELFAAISQHVGFIRSLEKNHFFPHLMAEDSLVMTVTESAAAVESLNDELKKYVLFDPSLEKALDKVEDLVGTVADRFIDWNIRKTMTVKEAAQLHNRSASTIYRWIKQGKLDATKVNRRWVIDPTIRDVKNDIMIHIADLKYGSLLQIAA